uniref:putative F-box protein At2g16220 n=1 Tax=Erigeron canadensis TaxID=72917 RepID=UPI001CB98661|nr:putative F-box protein At2g16220 [Erigeron canadensis]
MKLQQPSKRAIVAEVPRDNIYDIFSRLPLKSLARFQCVSKVWFDYMDDSSLQKMHAKRASIDPMLIMFRQFSSSTTTNPPCKLSFLRIVEAKEASTNYYALEASNKNLTMDFPCKEWYSTFPTGIIIGSCNGLIYSSKDHSDGTTLLVIHPLRKQFYELPPIKIWAFVSRFSPLDSCGLGFDDSNNIFKMVCVVAREQGNRQPNLNVVVKEDLRTMVHVLGTTSWREISRVPAYPITGEGIFANGCLHWLISTTFLNNFPNDKGRLVVCFDLRKEEFGLINPPRKRCLNTEQLVDLDGEVGYVYNIVDRGVEVWVLMQKEWKIYCQILSKTASSSWHHKGSWCLEQRRGSIDD